MLDIKLIILELRRAPLATFCGVLIAAVVYLTMDAGSQRKAREKSDENCQARVDKIIERTTARETFFLAKIDTIRIDQVRYLRYVIEKQAEIEAAQLISSKKRR